MKKNNLKKYMALLLSLLMLVHLFAVASTAETTAVNVQFKSMDTTVDLSNEGTVSRSVSSTYMEGAGAVKFEWTAARTGGLFWYIRCDDYANSPGVDITGATHMTFDFYISDTAKWELFPGGSGGTRINLNNNGDGWDNNACGQVTVDTMKSAFATVKTGWNHMILPIDTSAATSTALNNFRFYFSGATCQTGFYAIMDDVRFVNQAYLDSADYTDTVAAKDVIAQISALTNTSTKEEIAAVRSAYDALTDSQKTFVFNAKKITSEIVNIPFRAMDNALGLSNEGTVSRSVVSPYTEGTGAVKFEWTDARTGGLFWYVRCDNYETTSVDITGATHMIFDFYISDTAKWELFPGGSGGTRINLNNNGDGWDNNACGQVTVDTMKSAFATVKTGWNHMILPIDTSAATSTALNNFRFYFSGATCQTGFYAIMDDVRFVNQAYLDSADYTDMVAAKQATIAFSKLTVHSSQDELDAAYAIYEGLTDSQKALVPNYGGVGLEPVNVQFHSMDFTEGLDNEGTPSRTLSAPYTEGSAAVRYEWKFERTGLFWYVRCKNYATSAGTDIDGATHMIFDFYISDVAKWDIYFGSGTINLNSNAANWDNNQCGYIDNTTLRSQFEHIKSGWNHIVLPINNSSAVSTVLHNFRFYFSSATFDVDTVFMLDDVRFVNQAYLSSAAYADTLAAKDVIAPLSALTAASSPQELYDTWQAYTALTDAQKALVTNAHKWNALPTPPVEDPSGGTSDGGGSSGGTELEKPTYEPLDKPDVDMNSLWRFDTTNTYQTEDTIDKLPLTVEATICLPKDFADDAQGGVIFGNSPGNLQVYSFEIYTNGQVRMYISGIAQQHFLFTQTDVRTGGLMHIAVTIDPATKTASCYINGELAQTISSRIKYTGSIHSPLFIGGDLRGGNASHFKGQLLNVAAYSDVRTPEEIKGDVDAPGSDRLLFAYDLSSAEQNAAVVQDTSDNHNDMIPLKTSFGLVSQEPQTDDYAYTIAVIGDTQSVSNRYPENLPRIFDYLLEKKESTNLQYVIGLGDITDLDSDREWLANQEQYHRLDGIIPYSIVRGNHDTIQQYNKYFPASDFSHTTFGSYDGTMLNTWQTLEIGQIKYLLVNLDYGPSDAVLAWAGNVIKAHPEHNVIINTHSYLDTDGTTHDAEDNGPTMKGDYANGTRGYNDGDDMWDKLISRYPNITMVLAGHVSSSQIVVNQTKGVHGNTVTTMLINPQEIDTNHSGQGMLGMVAMLHFSQDGKTVQVRWYSTIQQKWYSTTNQFTVELDLVGDEPILDVTYGDVDGNGKVEAVDALEVLKSVVGKVTLTDEQLVKADTDGNSKADATDALNILKKVVGKIDKFPVEQ